MKISLIIKIADRLANVQACSANTNEKSVGCLLVRA